MTASGIDTPMPILAPVLKPPEFDAGAGVEVTADDSPGRRDVLLPVAEEMPALLEVLVVLAVPDVVVELVDVEEMLK